MRDEQQKNNKAMNLLELDKNMQDINKYLKSLKCDYYKLK